MTDHADYRDDAPPVDRGDDRLDMEHPQPDDPQSDNEPSPHEGEAGQESDA
jgi:hypothetical protein